MAEVQQPNCSAKGRRRHNSNRKTMSEAAVARKEIEDRKALALVRLNSGEYKTKPRESSSSTNYVSVFDQHDVYMELVQCTKCKKLYSLKMRAGTTHLLRHKQSCDVAAKDPSTVEPKKQARKVKCSKKKKTSDLSPSEKANFTAKVVEMCGRDLRPFNIVTGQGFRNVLQECVKIGSEHGEVDVESFIPHPTTVSRKASDLADELREKLLPQVRSAVQKGYCAMDADMWTDKFTKTSYLCITSQHVTDEWELKSDVLCTAEFPTEEKKTGQNILQEIKDNLAVLNIEIDDLSKVTFVTDQGANIKLALSSYKRVPCVAHLLATVLRHLLDEDKFLKQCPSILASIKSCKNVVTHLKRSGFCKLLDKSLKQMVETRWNTEIDMLMSLCTSLPSVIEILTQKGEMNRLTDWDGELMTELLTFLTSFKEVTEDLQAKKVPTMHLVLVKIHELIKNCEISDSDSEEMKQIKAKAKSLLLEKVELQELYYVAAFLCPNIRKLKGLSVSDRNLAHSYVRKMCKDLEVSTGNSNHMTAVSLSHGPTPCKKSRFGEWCDASDGEDEDEASEASQLEAEIALYLSCGKHDSEDPAMLLPWWQKRADAYPRLAKLARKVLGIPATSASSERNFSRAGLIVTEKRSCLNSGKVNDLLVIHNYYLNQLPTNKKPEAKPAIIETQAQEELQEQSPEPEPMNEDTDSDTC